MLVEQPDKKTIEKLNQILLKEEYDSKHESFLLKASSYFPIMTVVGLDILEYLEKIGTFSITHIETIPQWRSFA